ncbi:MAG: hypothetical protein JOZ41_02085 [Chloroflexi bacterium]|nr:hypothetical protein [Chloroflexota bacterium]
MRKIRIDLLDERSQTLFGERDVLEGRYPSGMCWESAAENLYNRSLSPDERYRAIQTTGLIAPIYVYFSYRSLNGQAVLDPLCRVTLTECSPPTGS